METIGLLVSTSFGSAALLAVLGFFFRTLIVTRLTRSVQHEFDTKLEAIRSEYRERESRITEDLRRKGATIDALRTQTFNAVSSRRIAVDGRRLNAIDTIWTIVVSELRVLAGASTTLAAFNFEPTMRAAAANEQLREMFRNMLPAEGDRQTLPGRAEACRPYLTARAWALFYAHYSIVMFGYFQMKLLASGINQPNLLTTENIERIIGAALPHQLNYIRQYGSSVYSYLLGELEGTLLAELRSALDGREATAAIVADTADLLATTYDFDAEQHRQSQLAAIEAARTAGAVAIGNAPPQPALPQRESAS